MLENKNNTLPLSNNIKKIAVIGPNANNISSQYGDWTFYTHPKPDFSKVPKSVNISIWDGIREIAEKNGIQAVLNEWEGADVVIAVIGDDPTLNGEEKDRANLDLPYAQQAMLEAVKEAGHKLIVVGVSGKPLIVTWAKENADAMLWTFCPGMYGGSAVAGVLFGDVNPSARLPISFPLHVGQLPVYYNQLPGWHGEKYIDLPKEPLYTFGYGLSYCEFEFTNLKCPEEINADSKDDIKISVSITNKSTKDGTSVVQLYFRDMVSTVSSPVKQFKGFERVYLKAGESREISIKLPMSELAIIDHDLKRKIEKGAFKIIIGDGQYLEKEFQVV